MYTRLKTYWRRVTSIAQVSSSLCAKRIRCYPSFDCSRSFKLYLVANRRAFSTIPHKSVKLSRRPSMTTWTDMAGDVLIATTVESWSTTIETETYTSTLLSWYSDASGLIESSAVETTTYEESWPYSDYSDVVSTATLADAWDVWPSQDAAEKEFMLAGPPVMPPVTTSAPPTIVTSWVNMTSMVLITSSPTLLSSTRPFETAPGRQSHLLPTSVSGSATYVLRPTSIPFVSPHHDSTRLRLTPIGFRASQASIQATSPHNLRFQCTATYRTSRPLQTSSPPSSLLALAQNGTQACTQPGKDL